MLLKLSQRCWFHSLLLSDELPLEIFIVLNFQATDLIVMHKWAATMNPKLSQMENLLEKK